MKFGWLLCALLLIAFACNIVTPPKPSVTWDTSPTALIIEASQSGGLVPQTFSKNNIPAARVWGDGRMVWVQYGSGGGRRVLEGQLSTPEMTDLLKKISDAGFFGWQDYYKPRAIVMDASTATLTIHLLTQSKSVSEYAGEGAPEKFHELFNLVGGGAGASGTDFIPTRGYLTAFPTGPASGQARYHWPESMGYDLGTAVNGRYIEGEGLAFAWKILNENLYGVVESGGQDYQIALQVPGISSEAPPAP